METLGLLASIIFNRIVHGNEEGETKLFSTEAVANYAVQIGMNIDTTQVQNMVDRLIAANLIHRRSQGVYAVADPFVGHAWRQRKAIQL